MVNVMKVKCFDENHEKDLEFKVNSFLATCGKDVVDIKFQVALAMQGEDQIFCFSAMVIYYEN